MTQDGSAQDWRKEIAWKPARKERTLAQRRAGFEAQMRAMAIADLQAVADRLKSLHARLERETGQRWTQQEITTAADVRYRTYQTWVGAKNENEGGDGYRKLTGWYRRKLKDDTITYNWLVWGQQEPPQEETLITPSAADPYAEQLDRIEEKVDDLRELVERLNPPAEETPPGKQDQAIPEPSLPDPPPIAPDPDEPKTDEEGRQQSA